MISGGEEKPIGLNMLILEAKFEIGRRCFIQVATPICKSKSFSRYFTINQKYDIKSFYSPEIIRKLS